MCSVLFQLMVIHCLIQNRDFSQLCYDAIITNASAAAKSPPNLLSYKLPLTMTHSHFCITAHDIHVWKRTHPIREIVEVGPGNACGSVEPEFSRGTKSVPKNLNEAVRVHIVAIKLASIQCQHGLRLHPSKTNTREAEQSNDSHKFKISGI